MTLPTSSGPWAVGSNGATVKVVDSEGKAVCMLTPRRDQFNGDLIAAAPALLDALSELVGEWDALREGETHRTGYTLDTYGVQLARAAIAKATGVQS